MGLRKKLKSNLNKKSYAPMIKVYSLYKKDIWGFLRWRKSLNYKRDIYNILKYKKQFFNIMLYEIHRGMKFKVKKYEERHHNFFLRRVIRLYYKGFRERFFGKLGRLVKRKAGTLVNHFFSMLERRLDMLAVRSFYFNTIMQSRKYIMNRNIYVNKVCISNPRFIVNIGDIISFTSKPRYFNFFVIWRRFFSVDDFFYFLKFFDKLREFYENVKFYSFVRRSYKANYNKKYRWQARKYNWPKRLTPFNRMFKIFSFFGRFRLFLKKFEACNTYHLVDLVIEFFSSVQKSKWSFFFFRWVNYFFIYRRQLFLQYRCYYFFSHWTRYVRVRRKGRWMLEKFLRARKRFFLQRYWSLKRKRKRMKSYVYSHIKYIDKHGFLVPLKEKVFRMGVSKQVYNYLVKKDEFNAFFFAGLPPYLEPNFKLHKVVLVKEPTVKHVRYPFMANHFKNYAFFENYRKRSYF